MNHLEAPLTVGIVFYFTYMIFELFARRNERIAFIEKMGQNLSPMEASELKTRLNSLLPSIKKSFTALRMGCLLLGVGMGLLVGLFIYIGIRNNISFEENWERDSFYSMSYGAPVLLFGGLGLIISYLIEKKDMKKDEDNIRNISC